MCKEGPEIKEHPEQEGLEVLAQSESSDRTAIAEMWCKKLHSWSTKMEGYKLYEKGRAGGAREPSSMLRGGQTAKGCL